MAQTCPTVGDVWWNGLGAALIGGLTAAIVATGVVLATRTYERRHINEQEARAAAKELMKESRVYLQAIGDALSNSPEDRIARASAHWRWLAATQLAEASMYAVDPRLVNRINVAAARSIDTLAAIDEIGVGEGSAAWKAQMQKALTAATEPVLQLNLLLANWVGTNKVGPL
jgi:hypothetical protein